MVSNKDSTGVAHHGISYKSVTNLAFTWWNMMLFCLNAEMVSNKDSTGVAHHGISYKSVTNLVFTWWLYLSENRWFQTRIPLGWHIMKLQISHKSCLHLTKCNGFVCLKTDGFKQGFHWGGTSWNYKSVTNLAFTDKMWWLFLSENMVLNKDSTGVSHHGVSYKLVTNLAVSWWNVMVIFVWKQMVSNKESTGVSHHEVSYKSDTDLPFTFMMKGDGYFVWIHRWFQSLIY